MSGEPVLAALSFTRFIFIVPRRDDEAFRSRLRAAGSAVARGFFNDFDADGAREGAPHETIHFLDADRESYADSAIAAARHVVQVTGKYRPRLAEVETELRRRLGDAAGLFTVEGAERPARYTNAELHEVAHRPAAVRRPGRIATHVVLFPLRKRSAWWALSGPERSVYFYPHVDEVTGTRSSGHAVAAQDGLRVLFRRYYHNPDGYARPGEFDFIAAFECTETDLDTFARVHRALRDTSQNPEWRYVEEGPLWVGRRVLRW